MKFVYNDGGRYKYFKAEGVRDCCVRAICNATGKDYKEVYDGINEIAKSERTGTKKRTVSNARNGVYSSTARKYIEGVLGWEWHPTMTIGSGCKVHLRKEDLPKGPLIVRISKHYTCVKNGMLYDTWDCQEDGTRCVYGYWAPPEQGFKCKKVKEHKLVEYDITYEWEGKQKTRRITFKDGRPYEYDGFIMSKELQYIKELTEGYDL